MAVITLTSDLGQKDPYLATVKGRMLRRCPGVTLIDISHDIAPWHTPDAAFALRQSYPHFPNDTIHWVGVHSQLMRKERYLVVFHKGQYFICPDDGLFSLLFDDHPDFLFAIRTGMGEEQGDHGIYSDSVMAAGHLASGRDILEVADQVQGIAERSGLRPLEGEDFIRCSVIHIDHFGNAILNVDRETIQRVANGRTPSIRLRGSDRIERFSQRYSDVVPGERLAFFNAFGQLEIAVNQGNASELLGLKLGALVQVQFIG